MIARLDKAATHCSMDRTEFIRNATLAQVAEVEEAIRAKKLTPVRAASRVPGGAEPFEPAIADEAPGLGIGEIFPSIARNDSPSETKPTEDPVSRLAQAIVERLEKKPADPIERANGQNVASGWLEKLSKLLP